MIYFIAASGTRLVKIGYSARHPSGRLAKLQTSSPHPLVLMGMLEGSVRDEKEWHQRFAHLRIHGEWFRWDQDLRIAAKPHLFETARAAKERARHKLLRDLADCERMIAEARAV